MLRFDGRNLSTSRVEFRLERQQKELISQSLIGKVLTIQPSESRQAPHVCLSLVYLEPLVLWFQWFVLRHQRTRMVRNIWHLIDMLDPHGTTRQRSPGFGPRSVADGLHGHTCCQHGSGGKARFLCQLSAFYTSSRRCICSG